MAYGWTAMVPERKAVLGFGVERAGSTRRDGHRQDPGHDRGQGTHIHEKLQAALLPLFEVIGELSARIVATAGCAFR